MAAQAADADALSERPNRRPVFADGNDASDHLVARHAGRLLGRLSSFKISRVGPANAEGFDFDQHLAGARPRRLAFHQLQRVGRRDLHRPIRAFQRRVSSSCFGEGVSVHVSSRLMMSAMTRSAASTAPAR